MATKVQFAFKPYPEQQIVHEYIHGKHLNQEGEAYRFLVLAFGRQAGKSWFARYEALDQSINHNKYVMWVSPALSSARNHWNKLVKLLRQSKIPCKINIASKEIHFPSGGAIVIRSADIPDNLRGDGVDFLILDEAAFFPNGEYIWQQVCQPMITATRGVVMFCSTPKGRNWFYDVYAQGIDPKNEYYKSWSMKSEQSPYQDKKLLKFLKKTMPNLRWREEYEAEFLLDGGGVFVGIERAAKAQFLEAPLTGHTYVMGIDPAPVNDNYALTVIDKDTRQQVYGEAFTSVGVIQTIQRTIELLDLWQPEITHIEKNGVGEYFIQMLRAVLAGQDVEEIISLMRTGDPVEASEEVVGGHRLRTVHMDNETKRSLVERLSADIEFGRLQILEPVVDYGTKQISEISTFIRKPTKSGQGTTYAAKEGSHDDRVSALYLAYKGMPKPPKVVQAGKKKKDLTGLFNSRGKNLHAQRSEVRKSTRPTQKRVLGRG